jgi:hypothetical protein
MADHHHHEDNTNDTKQKKRVYFAPPVVGFFREPHPSRPSQSTTTAPAPAPAASSSEEKNNNHHPLHTTNSTAATNTEEDEEGLRESLTASRKNVTFQINHDPGRDDDSSSDEEDDEEMGSISSFVRARRSSSYGSMGSFNSSSSKRSGKELWAIVRRHVLNNDFHIRDTVRQAALFQSIGPGARQRDDVHFRNIDLPYDFSLFDCFLALLAYLAISVIAFSFVFEQWSMVDSMYFAVVTFTTIGMLLTSMLPYPTYPPSFFVLLVLVSTVTTCKCDELTLNMSTLFLPCSSSSYFFLFNPFIVLQTKFKQT